MESQLLPVCSRSPSSWSYWLLLLSCALVFSFAPHSLLKPRRPWQEKQFESSSRNWTELVTPPLEAHTSQKFQGPSIAITNDKNRCKWHKDSGCRDIWTHISSSPLFVVLNNISKPPEPCFLFNVDFLCCADNIASASQSLNTQPTGSVCSSYFSATLIKNTLTKAALGRRGLPWHSLMIGPSWWERQDRRGWELLITLHPQSGGSERRLVFSTLSPVSFLFFLRPGPYLRE